MTILHRSTYAETTLKKTERIELEKISYKETRPRPYPSRGVPVFLELSEHGLPEDVQTAFIVSAEEFRVKDLDVRVQEIHEGRDGVHGGKSVRGPSQVEDVLL